MSRNNIVLSVEHDGVATIAISGQDELNRFTTAMRDELVQALAAVDDHPDLRALVIRSARSNFCVGGDVREFGTADDIFEARRARWAQDPWLPLWRLSVPTVASLRGFSLGSGFELALYCDIRIAGRDVVIGLPELGLGMLPAAGGTQTLTRFVGLAPGVSLPLTGRRIGADEAYTMRLVHEICDDPDRRALELAYRLSGLPPAALVAARRAVKASVDLSLESGRRLERRLATIVGP